MYRETQSAKNQRLSKKTVISVIVVIVIVASLYITRFFEYDIANRRSAMLRCDKAHNILQQR